MVTIVACSGVGARRFHPHTTPHHTTTNKTSRDMPFVSTCHGEGTSLAVTKYWVFVLSRYEHPIAHPIFFHLGTWGKVGGVEWINTAVICNVCLMLKLCHKIHIIEMAKCSITPNLNHQVHTSSFLISSESKFLFYFLKLQYTGYQPISVTVFGWRVNHVTRLISPCLQKMRFF